MNQKVLIRASLAEAASCLDDILKSIIGADRGFLVTLSADPAPRDRMRFHEKGGPDAYLPLPPLARQGALEVWHSNHRDSYFRCATARLTAATLDAARGRHAPSPASHRAGNGADRAEGPETANGPSKRSVPAGEGCRLSWDPVAIRIDFAREWKTFLMAANETLSFDLCTVPLQSDPLYLPPHGVAEARLFVGIAELDSATKERLDRLFRPGFLRYERIADRHGGGDLVRYRILGDLRDGGDFGEIWIRADGREWTSAILCALAVDRITAPGEEQAALALPPEAQAAALARLDARLAAAMSADLQAKIPYLEQLWGCYMKSLPPRWLSPFREDVAEDLARSASHLTEIEAEILALWCEGLTRTEIAATVGRTPAYITNVITNLRTRLGPELVPLRRPDRSRKRSG